MRSNSHETFVVTGASSGIGRELAIQLSAPGRIIWLIGRDRQRLAQVADEVRLKGGVPEVAQLDLGDLDAVGQFLETNFPSGSRVDWVYLGAAITAFGEVRDTLIEDWRRIYLINLLSQIQMTTHFYGNMVSVKHGHIVLISSLAAYAGYPTATAYATMKAGLLGLYRSLVHEGKAHGVSVYLASLGYVGTGIYRSAIYRKTSYEDTMESIDRLGFGILSAEEAARRIIGGVNKGRREFAIPAYAAVMKWAAPRFPALIGLIHNKIMKQFKRLQ